ncbi:hypothetical protein EDC04DRAFT_2605727 [Pisolithus marmoratus]|nr:hypothetical protein EDC04DRAFT_2605727 [Pisolithus marmoratus]
MPLEPTPQQSPRGKNSSPPKHQCPTSDPCPVHLSDIGKRYHSFPKGTFKARFAPPVLPRFVLAHFASHPSTWTWVTKDGPNKGKSFQVPTTPITCDKTAPKAVRWMVAVFHSYKAHPNPVAIDSDNGRVKQGWLRLYQNNMYVHLRGQLKARASPKRASPPTTKPPPTPLPACPKPGSAPSTTANPSLEHVLAELQKELADLREKFTNYISSHEACCARNNHSSAESSGAEDDHDDDDQSDSHSPPILYITDSKGAGIPDPNPPTWLATAVANPDIPPIFQGAIYSPDRLSNDPLPRESISAVKLIFVGASPLYLGLLRDRSLVLATSASREVVDATLRFPHDPSVPTARH